MESMRDNIEGIGAAKRNASFKLDSEGAKLRKDLAYPNVRKARPIDQKEDAKLRQ